MKLSTLLQDLIPEGTPLPEQNIHGLRVSSVSVQPDDVFIALGKGQNYIPDAIKQGAQAVLVDTAERSNQITVHSVPVIAIDNLGSQLKLLADRCYGPMPELSVIGVTGTNGKTTISYILAQCLQMLGEPCGLIGTLGYGQLGDLKTTHLTTPDPISLREYMTTIQSNEANVVAMEVSSHALAQGRVDELSFESALFSNLTQDHLDYHGDLVSYGEAKLKLFTCDSLKRVILNIDDPFARKILQKIPHDIAIVLCSQHPKATLSLPNDISQLFTITVEDFKLTTKGIQANILTPLGEGRLRAPLVGAFNLNNLLLVIGELLSRNYALPDILRVMSEVVSPPGRMERFKTVESPQVIVDYAHTPDALENALKAVREHTEGKLWCVFGCGGDRDQGKRAMMGEVASRFADCIMLTNDNPRTEDPEAILSAIKAGISPEKTTVWVEANRQQAIEQAVQQAGPTDTILIAGKGHEDYQIIGTQRAFFSDAGCVQSLLGEKPA